MFALTDWNTLFHDKELTHDVAEQIREGAAQVDDRAFEREVGGDVRREVEPVSAPVGGDVVVET